MGLLGIGYVSIMLMLTVCFAPPFYDRMAAVFASSHKEQK